MKSRRVQFYIGASKVYEMETDFEFKVGDKVIVPVKVLDKTDKLLFEVNNVIIDVTCLDPIIRLSNTGSIVV